MNIIKVEISGIPCRDRSHVLMAVLTQGAGGEYACYCGIVPLNSCQSERTHAWVAGSGSKQNLQRAKAYFPMLTEENYRA